MSVLQIIAIVTSLAFTAVAVAFTAIAVRKILGVIRIGQPALNRTGNPVGRTLTMLKETVLHTRMLQWTWVGILHWFAFAAFIVLATAVLGAYGQLFDPYFALPIFGHWPPYTWIAEFLGLLGTLAIVPLFIYRVRNRPSKNGRNSRFFGSTMWQAYFVEAMVVLESSAILFIRGAEYKLFNLETATQVGGSEFPISQLFSNLYPTENAATLENIIVFIAMVKIVSAMIWLLIIANNLTMGVAWHRFTAFFNIWFKREDSGKQALGTLAPLSSGGKAITLDDIDDLDEESVLGAGKIEDFSWKGILDFTTCTECGRCQSQCPAWNTEKPLSPKLLVMGLREHAYAKATGDEDHAERVLVGKTDAETAAGEGAEVLDWFYNPESGDFVIDEDVLWSCTSCGACVQQCPVDIEHVDHIMDMRRYQVLVESNFPAELNQLFRGMENNGNPWNMSSSARMDWAKGLDFDVPVVGEDLESLESVDWLFWVGCAGAYEDRAKKTTRAVAELLNIAGISFGVLGNGETCTGDSARRAGNEFVFQGLAQQNIETFKEYKVKKVVSTCAHCFNTLKNEYKEFGIELEVVHHTQLLNRLVREGKLTPVKEGAGAQKRSITYHDPCFLGRHNQVYEPPRELLQILPGAEYVEMERANERSFCCGAGGARMWMEETIGSRINENRTQEAVATGADQIAVGCPFCRVMLADGLTSEQSAGRAGEAVEVLDVAQMLLASVKGEQATKLAPGQSTAAPAAKITPAQSPTATPLEENTEPTPGSLFDDAPGESAPADASSLFDTPAPADPATGGSLFDEGTGSTGGSLFDETPSGSLFDTPAPEEPEAKAAPEQAEPEKPAEPAGDLGAGSLFDVAPAAEPAPEAKSEPESKPEPETKAAPAQDLDAGGSLFDLTAPTEEPAAAAPAAEASTAPAPAAAAKAPSAPAAASSDAASAPRTDVDINAGSLFDIEAPEGAVEVEPGAASAAVAPAPDAPAETEVPAAPTPAAETTTEAPATEAPATPPAQASAPTTPSAPVAPVAASSGTTSAPRTDVDISAGSLFDIEAPEGAVEVEPGAAPAAVPAAPAAEAPVAEARVAEAPVAETTATEAPTPTPAAPAADVVASGEAHEPRTDVDINTVDSLFDL